MSKSPLTSYVDDSTQAKYPVWVAQYNSKCTYTKDYGMWQYSSTGSVDGISGNVDMDYCYKDYPGIIKKNGYNGYKKSTTTTTTSSSTKTTTKKTIAEIAQEVIAGKWGDGDTRKKKLTAAGYDYAAVQSKVNELLKSTSSAKTVEEIDKEVIAGKW
jgi:hypothetical protein